MFDSCKFARRSVQSSYRCLTVVSLPEDLCLTVVSLPEDLCLTVVSLPEDRFIFMVGCIIDFYYVT